MAARQAREAAVAVLWNNISNLGQHQAKNNSNSLRSIKMSTVQANVQERYAEGAKSVQADLCCPVDYDTGLLKLLPQEIIDKDYGCGDPSRYVQQGDVVLDLGSGGGKICYMAAQLVGAQGKVIGVDMTEDMLALARKYQKDMHEKIGGQPVEFHRGYIQDLALSLDRVDNYLQENSIADLQGLRTFEKWKHQQRVDQPLIASNSVDLVISNCVLNLVAEEEKAQLISEIYRVLKPGGRVAISDIISDEHIPEHLKQNPELWSGCISGAFHEKGFLDAFVKAGFVAVSYDKWEEQPWQVVDNIEFRSVTLLATKPDGDECIDRGHAAIYKGPYASVTDDEGHIFLRGERMAVCERTFRFLKEGPLKNHFICIEPAELSEPVHWCAPAGTIRPANETKGGCYSTAGSADQTDTSSSGSCCC